MNVNAALFGTLAFVVLATPSSGSAAGTELEEALAGGAKKLSADEIAERFVGKTGTWTSPSGDKTIRIHYGEDNDLTGKMVGADWSGTGYYGIANIDKICVSWEPKDQGRLRCLDVLVVDGTVKKFNADGSLNGSYANFEPGKSF